jgi:hypothetical protein
VPPARPPGGGKVKFVVGTAAADGSGHSSACNADAGGAAAAAVAFAAMGVLMLAGAETRRFNRDGNASLRPHPRAGIVDEPASLSASPHNSIATRASAQSVQSQVPQLTTPPTAAAPPPAAPPLRLPQLVVTALAATAGTKSPKSVKPAAAPSAALLPPVAISHVIPGASERA